MNEIRTMADQLRSRLAQPDIPVPEPATKKKKAEKTVIEPIIEQLRAYNTEGHKNVLHVRFDTATVQLLQHLKMAAGIDVTRFVSYAVRQLIDQNPELKIIVKQYLQKLEL